jgi:hypothetical protein
MGRSKWVGKIEWQRLVYAVATAGAKVAPNLLPPETVSQIKHRPAS